MGRPSKEYQAFVRLTDRLLAVPHESVQQRIAQHREKSEQNPSKRGPKRKTTSSGSGHEDA
jgi:hypothetical protein